MTTGLGPGTQYHNLINLVFLGHVKPWASQIWIKKALASDNSRIFTPKPCGFYRGFVRLYQSAANEAKRYLDIRGSKYKVECVGRKLVVWGFPVVAQLLAKSHLKIFVQSGSHHPYQVVM